MVSSTAERVVVEISVLIVTYNSERHITPCLSALKIALDGIASEVLIYDNASTDQTVGTARTESGVDVIPGDQNLGFARACNLLGRRARGRHLFFLNPDTLIHPESVTRLLAAVDTYPQAGLYGARTETPGGSPVPGSVQSEPTLWSAICFGTGLSTAFATSPIFNPEPIPGWDRLDTRPVPALSGGALMVSREAWLRVGGFDERFFMYGEDLDLCHRARLLGFQPVFVADAHVIHAVGGSSSAGHGLVLLHRGKVSYMHKHWSRPRALTGRAMLLLGTALRAHGGQLSHVVTFGRAGKGAARWREAWRRRAEWSQGWPSAGVTSST